MATVSTDLTGSVAQWREFFGHLYRDSSDFDHYVYPLGDDPGDEADLVVVPSNYNGWNTMSQLEDLGREAASLWAIGRFLTARSEDQKKRRLLGIGARYQFGDRQWRSPMFYTKRGRPYVCLCNLEDLCGRNCHLLARKM